MTNTNTRSFEVSLHKRLQQSRHAINAVRLPKQGYSLYRVYKEPIKNPVTVKTRCGTIVFDSLFASQYTSHTVRWLKSKHVTLLKMKGVRVEQAKPDDMGVHVGL